MKTSASFHSFRAARLAGLASFAITATVFSAGEAKGSIVMMITESEGNVVASASGSANLTGAVVTDTGGLAGPGLWGSFGGFIRIGSVSTVPTRRIDNASGPGQWIPPLKPLSLATSSSGGSDLVGARGDNNQVYLPGGYVSGTPLNATSTWSGTTLESLGLAPGTYTWAWGTGDNFDSLTIQVIPEPSAAFLWLGAVTAAGLRRAQKL